MDAGVADIGTVASSKLEGLERSVVPSTGVLTPMVNPNGGAGYYFPRAIISRHKVLNADFSCPVGGA